jgi:pyrroloquinoline quinone biosynthesis protein B
VVVLGTAQDGGLPQLGCRDPLCVEARRDPARRRLVASLLVADPRRGTRYLIDATPDLAAQTERARPHPATRREDGERPPLFDGVLLTHAHAGHYLGLALFGREVYGARDLPVYVSDRFGRFLAQNGPWSLLVGTGAIRLCPARPDVPIALGEGLTATPLLVPHRDEFSDTYGFIVRGPRRALLYVPDIDKWERWDRRLEDVLATVDVALLDGTFAEDGEIPGRSMAEIPHPFIAETLDRLSRLPLAERAKVRFTHLNHTNPASDPRSRIAAAVRALGCAIAAEGEIHEL